MADQGDRQREYDVRVAVMCALDLALDVACHDGTPRDLAVAAEAYTLAGYHDGAIDIAHAGGRDAILARIEAARRGRPRRLLRADARGLHAGLTMLAEVGIVTPQNASEARRQRWLARGGHAGPDVEPQSDRDLLDGFLAATEPVPPDEFVDETKPGPEVPRG